VDPEAFFVQADDDKSQHLSTTKWNKICKVFVEDVTDDTIRTLFYEMAHGSDSISHSRFFEVAEEYRTVRHFVEKSECIGITKKFSS
jgi:Ca2+-binding EF-hand superfamily protein